MSGTLVLVGTLGLLQVKFFKKDQTKANMSLTETVRQDSSEDFKDLGRKFVRKPS